jgi:SAM-dependent methyltransferase
MRSKLALKYIQGEGCEIGGLHNPLPVQPGVQVTYVDRLPEGQAHPDQVNVHKNLVIDDAEFLHHFEDGTQDFLIANHVLEHCHDPIGTLKTWARVLKPGGIAFVALPEKTQTFDRNRPVTTLEHLISDHEHGSEAMDAFHYACWHYHVDNLRGDELEDRVRLDISLNANIHFHVFDLPAMRELFSFMSPVFKVKESAVNGAEVIFVLQKP